MKTGLSAYSACLHKGITLLLEELRRRVDKGPRPIGILAAGGKEAYALDHRPIWQRSAVPLKPEETERYEASARKASGLDLPQISRGAYPSKQVQRTLLVGEEVPTQGRPPPLPGRPQGRLRLYRFVYRDSRDTGIPC